MVDKSAGEPERGPVRYAAGVGARVGRLGRNARADGYDQLLVDAMRTANVAFGVALANGASLCEVQLVAGRGPQHLGEGRVLAGEGRRRRL